MMFIRDCVDQCKTIFLVKTQVLGVEVQFFLRQNCFEYTYEL